jgi:sulfur dioxygenase
LQVKTIIKSVNDIIIDGSTFDDTIWDVKVLINDDNFSYVVWHKKSLDGIIVDPAREDLPEAMHLTGTIKNIRWLVIDTHTHADHISGAAELANKLDAPLIMSQHSPSTRIQIRISADTTLPLAGGPLKFIASPGHTPDSMSLSWGPFLFTGDTILFGETGRDDLPGGNSEIHFLSLEKIKKQVNNNTLVLPCHDSEGGRISSWATQMKVNSALTQSHEQFVSEATSYASPAPRLLKESLFENFR